MSELTITLLFFACTSLAFMFSMGCCCSAVGCTICNDLDDNPRTCGPFTVAAGTADLVTFPGVIMISAANTVVLADAQDTSGHTAAGAQATFISGASGDKPRIFIKYKDSSHYVCAEFNVAGASSVLKIIQNTGVGETVLATSATFTANELVEYTFNVCYGDGAIVTIFIDPDGATHKKTYVVATTINDAPKAGVGSGALTGGCDFTDFKYWHGHEVGVDLTCPSCIGKPCEDGYSDCCVSGLPTQIDITLPASWSVIAPGAGNCPLSNAASIGGRTVTAVNFTDDGPNCTATQEFCWCYLEVDFGTINHPTSGDPVHLDLSVTVQMACYLDGCSMQAEVELRPNNIYSGTVIGWLGFYNCAFYPTFDDCTSQVWTFTQNGYSKSTCYLVDHPSNDHASTGDCWYELPTITAQGH